MALPRSVTVKLKSGVTHAVLPDNRSMVAATNYDISYRDWLAISANAKAVAIDFVSFNSAVKSVEKIDLTTNTAALPTYSVGGVTFSRKLGQVTYGFEGELFKLVKVDASSAAVAAGTVCVWGGVATRPAAGKLTNVVTSDFSDITDFTTPAETLQLAGVAVGTITAGQYGWLQLHGNVPTVKAATDVANGDQLDIHPTTDGTAWGNLQDEVQVVTMSVWAGTDSFKLTYQGVETVAFVRGTNGTAAAIQAALRTLTGNASLTVTGTTDAGPFTVTFVGGQKDETPLTVTSPTGTAAGSVAETQKGGAQPGQGFGVALTDVSGGFVEGVIENPQWAKRAPRIRRRDLFTNPR